MKRCGCGGGGSISSPLVAAAMLFLLLLLLLAGSFHCAAAARLLPSSPSVVPAAPQLVHQENGAETADGLALQDSGANGDELSSVSEMMGAETAAEEEEEGEVSCEEGDDECLQRRLLRDAHLDYIYTQHKGKP